MFTYVYISYICTYNHIISIIIELYIHGEEIYRASPGQVATSAPACFPRRRPGTWAPWAWPPR